MNDTSEVCVVFVEQV